MKSRVIRFLVTPYPIWCQVATPIVRRLDCAHYDGCLDKAADWDWPGFACTSCFAYKPFDQVELERQRSRLVALALHVLALLGVVRPTWRIPEWHRDKDGES